MKNAPLDYPLWVRAIEIAGIAAFVGLAATMGPSVMARIAAGPWGVQWTIEVVGAVVAGFLLADLISGIVHFWCDHVGTEQTPVIGPIFVKHFLAHHEDPDDIAQHDFIETNGNNFLASAVLLLPAYLWWWLMGTSEHVHLLLISLSACSFLAVTNQSHQWAHLTDSETPRAVQRLQRAGLLLSKERHHLHHRDAFDRNFCITSGILNPLLEKIRFFDAFGRVFGARRPPRDGLSNVRV